MYSETKDSMEVKPRRQDLNKGQHHGNVCLQSGCHGCLPVTGDLFSVQIHLGFKHLERDKCFEMNFIVFLY